MISLGRIDAGKDIGLGFGGGGDMEDTELEEGEACSDHNFSNNNNDDDYGYDDSVDPDIALSYIDVKLQDVLGHFQKDFEGGVSAENLGAKFGGYGSFLPTYQRSPIWSRPRTPPTNQSHNAPRSQNNLLPEDIRHGTVSSSDAPQLSSLTRSKISSSPSVAVEQAGMPSSDFAKVCMLRDEYMNKKSTDLSDQKLLKVRIKVGSDKLSTQKNAAIYNGLGLDVSPSSSLDGSPSGNEGMFHGPQDSPFESPGHILQIMTSFPVRGNLLLSPLSDDLIHLKEKSQLHKGSVPFPIPTTYSESSGTKLKSSVKGDCKKLREKKAKSLERNEILAEPRSENNKDYHGGNDALLKKEIDADTLASDDLVSNTTNLPLLMNADSGADAARGMVRTSNVSREVSNDVVGDKGCSNLMKEEPLGSMSAHDDTWVGHAKATTTAGKILEEKKASSASSLDNVPVYPQKVSHRKGEKPHGSVKCDPNISKEIKTAINEPRDTLKLKGDQKFTSSEHEGTKCPSVKNCPSSGGKKKAKGSQSQANIVADVPKDSLEGGSSLMAKNKKRTSLDEYITDGELENSKLQKNKVKAGDRYKDFFGDFELEQEDIQRSSLEMRYENRQRDSDNTIKEKLSVKRSDRLPITEVHPKTALAVAPSGNGPTSDVAPAATEDNWVCCDKCQKWRLLPLGKNPNDLPEKWLCSMLNWLPGMNRCSFSEEETTNAVIASNHAPTLASQNNLPTNLGGVVSTITMVGDQLDQNNQNLGLHAMPSSGKKKPSKDGSTQLSNSMKKRASLTNGSLNEVNQPMVSEPDFLKLSKTSGATVEKRKNKQKDKHKVLDNSSNGGDSWKLKMKGKRDPEEDLFRASKKIRAEGFPEDLVTDHVNIEKVGPSSSNGLPTTSSGKNLPKNNIRTCSNDQVSARKSKDKVPISMDDVPNDMGKQDDREVGKKRKVKGSYDIQYNTGSIPNTGHDPRDSRIMVNEEFSDNEYRKEKKSRGSRSDGKESSASRGSGRTDGKASHRKNPKIGRNVGSSASQRSLDGVDYSKRDSGSQHPSVAATSSSSKVSGSHKTKSNFLETKGSPVESVSSSPLRVARQGKIMSGHRSSIEKDDFADAGAFALNGGQRCSDGEDDGGSNQFGAAGKDRIHKVARHGSHETSVLDFQEKNFSCVSGGKAKQQIMPSPDVVNHHLANDSSNYMGQENRHSGKTTTSERGCDDDRQQENHYHVNGSCPRKSQKRFSSCSKDKNRVSNSELNCGKSKVSDTVNEQAPSYELKLVDGNNVRVKSDESENVYTCKKDLVGFLSSESSKKESQTKIVQHRVSASKVHVASIPRQNLLLDPEASAKKDSPSLPPTGGAQNEVGSHCLKPASGYPKGIGETISVTNVSDVANPSKTVKEVRKVDQPNGTHQNSSRNPLSNGNNAKDIDAPSPVKRDSSSQGATNALKEAKTLKHMADRLKNSGSNLDSTKLYFEAALKFLHGASLLETCSSENAKSGEMTHSMKVYSSTAKLCEFCAHEYEKSKDMAAAALAYKCMEVAYMRVIYSSNHSANKDRHELQTSLQVVPPGESPSSSASDVDNLNHPATTDKSTLAKTISSPQVTGSHIIAARNRPNFVRLLYFVQDINFAMEASRKSQSAFAAANVSLGETDRREGISSIKTALDYNFQDVEGLLRLVRLAIEAISR